jgi:hypothetical protein
MPTSLSFSGKLQPPLSKRHLQSEDTRRPSFRAARMTHYEYTYNCVGIGGKKMAALIQQMRFPTGAHASENS